jgi:hypothetical protein
MVRKYLSHNGLPSVGDGRARSFIWLDVLEWYLCYRVEIALRGGNQRSQISKSVRKLRNEAASAAKAVLSDSQERWMARDKRRQIATAAKRDATSSRARRRRSGLLAR